VTTAPQVGRAMVTVGRDGAKTKILGNVEINAIAGD
jgi:hypothetical protein